MSLLHIFLLLAISRFKFFSLRSLFMLSIHLRLGFLFFYFPALSFPLLPFLRDIPQLFFSSVHTTSVLTTGSSWRFQLLSLFLVYIHSNSHHSSEHFHFRHIHLLLFALLRRCCFKPIRHCISDHCFVNFALHFCWYPPITYHTRNLTQLFQPH